MRLGVALLAAAVTFWLQPVVRTIYLGQVNLILMAAIMWDLTQPDHTKNGKYRWWKGAATGIRPASSSPRSSSSPTCW